MIELGKKYKFRNREYDVHIYSVSGIDPYPVVGQYRTATRELFPFHRRADGKLFGEPNEEGLDLVEVKTKKSAWTYSYTSSDTIRHMHNRTYNTKTEAEEESRKNNPNPNGYDTRNIELHEIEWEE